MLKKKKMKHFSVLLIFVILFTNTYSIKPNREYIRKPENLGLMYKELEVTTKDAYDIATWFFPTQEFLSDEEFSKLQMSGAKREYKPLYKKPKPTIIICNGDAGNMSYFQLHLAEILTTKGFNVVTFDWRGFGESSPFEMDNNYFCYTEMLEDYRAVIDVVAKQKEVDKKSIVVMGWSTGAFLSMITAYNNDKVSAFIGRSIPTSFEDVIPLIMEKRNKTVDQIIVPEDFPKTEMPIFIAPNFNKPVFLINGEEDFRTPVWMSEKILAEMPKNIPTELMVVRGAAHGGKEDPIMLAFDEFIERVTDFLNKAL